MQGELVDTKSPALIFDFGNVVAYFDYARACAGWGRRLGISGEALLQRMNSTTFPSLVREYESGTITTDEFSGRVRALAGLDISHSEFAEAWADIFQENEPVGRLVASLRRRGHILLLGSNTNALHAAQFRRQFERTLAQFDHLILSFEIGHLKPSADFFRACVVASGQHASSCIFIDDLAENVAGARAAGLSAIVYRDIESLLDELRALGVDAGYED
jgi:HAD superfamily hydrolase (TIGR01509 family)